MNKIILFFLCSTSLSAQIKGVVKDSITGEPIPYTSIWIENTNSGVSSEIDGTFTINTTKDRKLQFSILGYKVKTAKISEKGEYLLTPEEKNIEEILVSNPKKTKINKVGISNKSNVSQLQGSNPQITAKYFKFDSIFRQTPFLKEIEVFTNSPIANATFKLRILEFDSIKQFPGKSINTEDIIVIVKKGQKKNVVDVSNLFIKIPKNGIVIGVENIIIESNKYVFSNKALLHDKINYAPQIVLNYVDDENSFLFMGLKWSRHKKNKLLFGRHKGEEKIIEPAINLILTN